MTSARMLLAAVASGLAACAYTPAHESIYLPNVEAGAPVLMVDGEVPPGFDDHVVVIVDHRSIARAVESGTWRSGWQPILLSGSVYAHRPAAARPAAPPGSTSSSGSAINSGSSRVGQSSRPDRSVTDRKMSDWRGTNRAGRRAR